MYALFNHMAGKAKHRDLPIAPNVSFFSPTNTASIPQWWVPTIASIEYAFTYFNQYTVDPNGLVYAVESNPVFAGPIQTVEPFYPGYVVPAPGAAASFWTSTIVYQQNSISITNIPVLTNDGLTNYDTANIDVRIYRSTDGGTTLYLLDSIPDGTTSYLDTMNGTVTPLGSTELDTRQTLYTTGGVVANDQPPLAKYIFILGEIAYYANLFDNGQYFPNRLRQALPGNPDSAPATFFDDFEDEIVGLSASRNNLIVFCKNSMFTGKTGGFNSLGKGNLRMKGSLILLDASVPILLCVPRLEYFSGALTVSTIPTVFSSLKYPLT